MKLLGRRSNGYIGVRRLSNSEFRCGRPVSQHKQVDRSLILSKSDLES